MARGNTASFKRKKEKDRRETVAERNRKRWEEYNAPENNINRSSGSVVYSALDCECDHNYSTSLASDQPDINFVVAEETVASPDDEDFDSEDCVVVNDGWKHGRRFV